MRYKNILFYFRELTGSYASVVFYTNELDEGTTTPTFVGWKLYSHSTEICNEDSK